MRTPAGSDRCCSLPHLTDLLQRGHEVVVTHQSQSVEHVDRLQGSTGHTVGPGTALVPKQPQTWRSIARPSAGGRGGGRAAGTHAEDVQAHRPFHALLVAEVVLGELVDGCGDNTHAMGGENTQSGWSGGACVCGGRGSWVEIKTPVRRTQKELQLCYLATSDLPGSTRQM